MSKGKAKLLYDGETGQPLFPDCVCGHPASKHYDDSGSNPCLHFIGTAMGWCKCEKYRPARLAERKGR